jgi:hypothetical protein
MGHDRGGDFRDVYRLRESYEIGGSCPAALERVDKGDIGAGEERFRMIDRMRKDHRFAVSWTSTVVLAATACVGWGVWVGPSSIARAEWAVAFGQNDGGHWGEGSSWNANERVRATNSALANCAQEIDSCKIISQGTNGCVALAVQNGGNGWSITRRTSLGAAISASMVNCVDRNPLGCSIKAQFCDRTDGFQEEAVTPEDKRAYDAAIERANQNRAQQQMQQLTVQTLESFVSGLTGGSARPAPSENGPAFSCRRPVDYEACIRQGVTGHGGGGPQYCSQQFC